MSELFFQPFIEYAFMKNALLACGLLGFSSVPLGLFLSYRRMTLTGDALSHAVLPGLALAFWFFGPSLWLMTLGGLLTGVLIAWFSTSASKVSLLKEDSTMAVSYILSLALGVFLVSLKGTPLDLFHFLFGQPLAVSAENLLPLSFSTLFLLVVLYLIYEPLKIMTVDFIFAQFLKVKTSFIHVLFMTLVVCNLIIAFQIMGTLLSVGLLVLPAVTARLFFERFTTQVLGGVTMTILCSWAGLLLSFHLNWPTAPTLILLLGLIFILGIFKKVIMGTENP